MTDIRKFAIAALCSLPVLWSGMAAAQDADGNDTPGDWRVEHYQEFGIWKSICDERGEGETFKQRCYIRYVDVFSPRPKFAAVFTFVFEKDRKTAFQYAFERGTVYADDGLRIDRDGATSWKASDTCRTGPNCLIENAAEVEETLAAFAGGGELVQIFKDRHGVDRTLKWDLTGFDKALADYKTESAKRNLLD